MKSRMLNWLQRQLFKHHALSDIEQARLLIQAVDRGGIPLNPARVNHIARSLGLEVSTRAPVDQTIARIRACVQRAASS
jgi:hypothetical protein